MKIVPLLSDFSSDIAQDITEGWVRRFGYAQNEFDRAGGSGYRTAWFVAFVRRD